jgi:hypothetical protein
VSARRVVLVFLLLAAAGAARAEPEPPDIRLIDLLEGLRTSACRGDLANLEDTEIHRIASRAGVDLRAPNHPRMAYRYANGRLFYLFYKTVENAFGDRPYVIQRIRRTERTWASEDDETPEEKTTHQVEVFKLRDDAIKRPDQHHGSFGIHQHYRREVVKEYEVGFGEVPGLCEGTTWPFAPGILFTYLQRYGEEGDVYDRVVFTNALRWTLTASLDRDGRYRVASPELGFDVPGRPPDASSGARKEEAAGEIVLHPGRGPAGVQVGRTTIDDLVDLLGAPADTDEVTETSTNHHYESGLTFNFDAAGRLNSVFTRPGFTGRTARGVRHGDPRGRVMEIAGVPRDQETDARTWRYDGVLFSFDAGHRVCKIVIFRP